MSSSLDRLLLSSIGKKLTMALTGLLLTGFLIVHLLGNLTLYAGKDGASFIDYANKIHDFGPLMYVAEVLLILLFGSHIWIAIRLTQQNNAARPSPYAFKETFGKSTPASRNMFITGSVVLGFLVVHILNFRLSEGIAPPHAEDLHEKVVDCLTNPIFATIYLIGSIVVGVHLSHGFRSAFQSLGVHHPRLNCCLRRLGIALAILIAAGFASFPIVAMCCWKGGQ